VLSCEFYHLSNEKMITVLSSHTHTLMQTLRDALAKRHDLAAPARRLSRSLRWHLTGDIPPGRDGGQVRRYSE
jgi:hypothetical protein